MGGHTDMQPPTTVVCRTVRCCCSSSGWIVGASAMPLAGLYTKYTSPTLVGCCKVTVAAAE